MLKTAYLGLLKAMSGLAGLLMAIMMVSIVIDVVLRNLGSQSSSHIFTFNEYFLFLIPLLGAPLLVRDKGHIYVEALLMQFPDNMRRWIIRLILVACVMTCLILAWYAGGIAYSDYVRNEIDIRSLDMPRWTLTIFMPLSFAMMAIEFGRFLVTGEDPYFKGDSKPLSY